MHQSLREFYTPSQPDGLPIAQSFEAHIARAAAGEALAFEHVIRNAQGRGDVRQPRPRQNDGAGGGLSIVQLWPTIPLT
jgi:hypothetical protein